MDKREWTATIKKVADILNLSFNKGGWCRIINDLYHADDISYNEIPEIVDENYEWYCKSGEEFYYINPVRDYVMEHYKDKFKINSSVSLLLFKEQLDKLLCE